MKAKEYLEQYRKIDRMIMNKFIEIEKWDALANSITVQMGRERVQSSGNQQKMEDAIVKSIDIKEEIELLTEKKKEITQIIELLPLAEYDIMHKVYIQGKELKEVQMETMNSYSWATTIHGRALKHVQDILDAKEL